MKKVDSTAWLTLPALVALASCATTGFQQSSFELVVEGDETSYLSFETAAQECGYTAFRRFPGATVQNNVTVGPHYNLSRVRSRSARCTTDWVDAHPEASLKISGE